MRKSLIALFLLALSMTAQEPRVKALVISGGCCHDYMGQDKILMETITKVIPTDWTVIYEGGTSRNIKVNLYNNPEWFKGYDIVIHNECYGEIGDDNWNKRIVAAHKAGVPSIVLHCSIHSYRATEGNDWREYLGVTSRRHTAAHRIAVKVTDNPILQGFRKDWVTPSDELYVIEKTWPNTTVLATAVSPEAGNAEYPVIWTNNYNGTRVFGTTLGHGLTWNEPEYQDLLVRGFKWALKRQ